LNGNSPKKVENEYYWDFELKESALEEAEEKDGEKMIVTFDAVDY
jgi:hypothetical protein